MKEFNKVVESLDAATRQIIYSLIMYHLRISRATLFRRLGKPDGFTSDDWEIIVELMNTYISPKTAITYTINQFSHETPTHLEPVPDTSVSGADAYDPGLRTGIGMDSHEEKPDETGPRTGQPHHGGDPIEITHA